MKHVPMPPVPCTYIRGTVTATDCVLQKSKLILLPYEPHAWSFTERMSSLKEAVLPLLPASPVAQLLKVAVTVPVAPGVSFQTTITVGLFLAPGI